MKPSNKGKDQQKQPAQKGKNKNEPEEEEEPQGPPPEKPLNLERFIYVTTYLDSNFMQTLKQLFEEINQAAFNLKSVKEIYTKGLTDEEKDNNEIDYISGFQLIDKNIRITILEGITGKAMKKIKETIPKTQMNNKNYMLFADSGVLFNKRLYSKFDLSLKYIKLRETLQTILQTFDIYTKANKYRQIYDAFLNFGSILKAQTLKEISLANLFPDAESEEEKNNLEKKENEVIEIKNRRPFVDARNPEYENYLKEKKLKRIKSEDIWRRNIEDLCTMRRKPHQDKFCRNTPLASSKYNQILFCPARINHYEEITQNMREKYLKDKNHFYTYSLYGLNLNFPMIERDRNEEYIRYIENKKKWHVKDKDFDRYKQPPREKYYFPKINNIL